MPASKQEEKWKGQQQWQTAKAYGGKRRSGSGILTWVVAGPTPHIIVRVHASLKGKAQSSHEILTGTKTQALML